MGTTTTRNDRDRDEKWSSKNQQPRQSTNNDREPQEPITAITKKAKQSIATTPNTSEAQRGVQTDADYSLYR